MLLGALVCLPGVGSQNGSHLRALESIPELLHIGIDSVCPLPSVPICFSDAPCHQVCHFLVSEVMVQA